MLMLQSDSMDDCLQSAISVQWLEIFHEMAMFVSFFQRFEATF